MPTAPGDSGDNGHTVANQPPPAEWKPRFNPWLIAASVMLGTFMEVLDTTVVTVSLPHIGGSLSSTAEEATWVLTSYLLSNAIILPATAWLGNRFGRKRVLMVCIVLFTASSAMCGAATSLGMLVAARVFQGMGGGALQPIAQAVLMESFEPIRRGTAMAAFSMGVIVAPILGPTLGGWITDNYSWRWVFYINLPIGLLAFVLVNAFVEDPPYIRSGRQSRIDYIGFVLMAVWLAATQIVLDRGQEDDWFAASWVRWLTAIAAVTMIAFVVRELLAREPIVNLRILRERNFAVGIGLVTVLGVCLYGTTSMLPLFLQTLLGYPAVDSGLAVSPRGLGAMLSSILVGRLIMFIDARIMVAVGFVILAFSSFMFAQLTLQISMASVVWAAVLNGMSTGMIFVPLSTMTMGRLRNEQMGNAAGLYSLMRNLGGSVGISLATTLLARRAQGHQAVLAGHLTPYDPAYEQARQTLQRYLTTRTNPVTAARQALGMLYNLVLQQATLMAFLDVFRALAVLALLCTPLAFLFARVMARRGRGPGRAAAVEGH
ncbi:MAG TPA: DHA2 family efflux MFS transporter permease subunit [Candidatus Methylomirabilis sp.]|nr:DHA2 family efflux MFS transporter permease subunit [Candidatus Methylomirabilis sp.]